MLGNHKGKRNFSLAQQMNEAILDLIKSINVVSDDKEIASVLCPYCKELVAAKDCPTHPCIGGAA